jgi:dihydropyrimidinase
MICMHAENGGAIDVIVQQALAEGKTAPKYHALTRPTTAEAEATSRAIALAEMAGAPVYIVHLSCNDALEKVREARDRGLPAYAETCPQYLYLSLEQMESPGFEGAKYVFTPPLREKWHQEKLWQGLAHDTLQVVSTDHCPFCFKEQKELGKNDFTKIPNGGPGIEHRLSLIYTGGVDADLVVFDTQEEQVISVNTHHMRVDYSMFEGIRVKGVPKTVLSRGRTIIDNGKFLGKAGSGEFIKRQRYSGL